MEENQLIDEILHTWVENLSIDDTSGESIVTEGDIDRLSTELSDVLNRAGKIHPQGGLISKLFPLQ